MERFERAAVLLSLAERLRDADSWCGETHVQKVTYFLQDLLEVPLEFDFILYKHGPYSFDLSDEISWMWANDFLKPRPQQRPYGPKLVPGERAELLKKIYSKSIEDYADKVQKIVDKFAPMKARALERYATAYYVSKEKKEIAPNAMAAEIVERKPHISSDEAHEAVAFVARLKSAFADRE